MQGQTLIQFLYAQNLGEYVQDDIGKNCDTNQIIDTADTCKVAAGVLGMIYNSYTLSTQHHPAGCYWHSDHEEMWFNEITDPSITHPEVFGPRGGVCRNTGKR